MGLPEGAPKFRAHGPNQWPFSGHSSSASGGLSRRGFLKLTGLSLASALAPRTAQPSALPEFPSSQWLGRVNIGKVDIKAEPDGESQGVDVLYQDAVVPWLREVVGRPFSIYAPNLRWVETPMGYIWSPYLQPVRNQPHAPIETLPETSLGPGMWVEVVVPWVDLVLDNPPARSPWLRDSDNPRLYYSQVLWVDSVKQDGQAAVWYRVRERFGYGDILWARAEAFRPVSEEEMSPIAVDVPDKRIFVDVTYQTLSCYEGEREVYFCRVSTGAKFNAQGHPVDEWSTPLGPHPIWRKVVSLHMSGGTTGGGYDLPGIAWTTLFSGTGVAIHATFWHNNFGVPMSHGCVNARPEDAKWIFRWSDPRVAYDPGDLTVSWPGGTTVEVIEK